jgi:hypothetical protein
MGVEKPATLAVSAYEGLVTVCCAVKPTEP